MEAGNPHEAHHYASLAPLPFECEYMSKSFTVLHDGIKETDIVKELPALLMSEEMKRKLAKEQVGLALRNIKSFAALAGLSDRLLFEVTSLSKEIDKELRNDESTREKEVAGSAA